MNDGLENLKQFTGANLEELWRVTSMNQARALGVDSSKGSLVVGKDADIVITGTHTEVIATIKGGELHEF
ncbi:amidohydrolase family protein [Staphylococcus hominis]